MDFPVSIEKEIIYVKTQRSKSQGESESEAET